MTTPIERTNAVLRTEEFLYSLLDPKQTPRVSKSIRDEALRLLRHYPTRVEMQVIADREDSAGPQFGMKIFGRDYA